MKINKGLNGILVIKEFAKNPKRPILVLEFILSKKLSQSIWNFRKKAMNSLCKAVKGQMPISAFMEIGATLLSKWRLEGLPFLSSNKIYKMVGNFRWNSNQRTDHGGKREKIVCQFQLFCDTQILREINFGKLKLLKNCAIEIKTATVQH